ncbi:endonuclease/exonuclease/phosphatase family protein [Brevibacillus borstelensis]|uniref:endonuclease/exonuclease/phosphatase family protein n=1 Tax=Brevibacillus borstelensis TaxID=45462 RepID=UPI0030BBC45E
MLRFITYNIHSGRDLFWRKRLREMGKTLQLLEADVIGLQEVHQNSKYGFQASYLAEELQYELAFSPSIPFGDGHYGNAVLSRVPITQFQTIALPSRKEMRSLLQSTISYKEQIVNIWVTHCSLNQATRHNQMLLIKKLAEQKKESPLVLMGDFNTVSASFSPVLNDSALACGGGHLSTIITFQRRIDYIFASPHWQIHRYETIPVKWSDHLPVLTVMELPLPAPEG